MIKRLMLLACFFPGFSMASPPADVGRLRYDERRLPLVDVQIDNRLHTLMLDTGSSEGIHLYQHDLERLVEQPSLKAVRLAPRRLRDLSGGENQVSAWRISRLFIGNIPFNDVEAVSFKPWGLSLGNEVPVSEVMGLGLFRDRKVLMDFENDRLQMLTHLPSDIAIWASYPFEQTDEGLSVTAFVGNKPLRLIVDTGASHSLLFAAGLPAGLLFSGCRSIEPEAENLDCRVTRFTLTDRRGRHHNDLAIVTEGPTSEALGFDGLLGMGFMRGHRVIIDMPERRLYISR